MTTLGPKDITHFTKPLFDLDIPQAERLRIISHIQSLTQSHPATRSKFVSDLASLLLITEEPPIAEQITLTLLELHVREAADYIHIAFEQGTLSPDFLGGWENVHARLLQAPPAAPVNLPSPRGNQNQMWEMLLFGKVITPTSPSAPAGSRKRRRSKR